MFDFMKQVSQLRQLQSQMKNERLEKEKDGIRVVVNGEMRIEEIRLNPDLPPEEQSQLLKNIINDAFEEIQKRLASKLQLGG